MRASRVQSVHEITDTIHGSERPLRVERFEPAESAEAAVVILHGADGLVRRGPAYRSLGRDLARRGYQALLPHYFESTGTPGHAMAAKPLDALGWLAAAGEVIDRAGASGLPVGIIGFSLGAYLGLAAASHDARVKAVVDCVGGLPDFAVGNLERMPPVLILHGEADPIVPASEAHRLARWLQGRGIEHEMHVYPGLGHGFVGVTEDDARARIFAFLDRHLWTDAPVSRPASRRG
ncbi:MAG TPA: dienelactone hydrolase family protein [Gemmataceae bacterium]|jgi:carboxymethylenebutenolidase|nr:dienelactone hydrolase family protein [Gemmataceae bacterium]